MPEQTLVMTEVQDELRYLLEAPALQDVRGAAALLETLARFTLPSLARHRDFGGAGIVLGGPLLRCHLPNQRHRPAFRRGSAAHLPPAHCRPEPRGQGSRRCGPTNCSAASVRCCDACASAWNRVRLVRPPKYRPTVQSYAGAIVATADRRCRCLLTRPSAGPAPAAGRTLPTRTRGSTSPVISPAWPTPATRI